jgi:hypothetical protein
MSCTQKSVFQVRTILGLFYICSDCKTKHPIIKKYLLSDYVPYTDSTPRMCECEDISHMVEIEEGK